MRKKCYKKCKGCGLKFSFLASQTEIEGREYCTRACSNKVNANRNSLSKFGEKNPMYKKVPWNYKGGVVKNKSGSRKVKYIGITIPVHRRVMEIHLGRMLKDNEIVHHIDGNGLNNKLSNLQLMSKSEHSKLHSKEITRDSRSRFIKSN